MLHCKLHRNVPHVVFKCVGANCKQTFCTYAAFKSHFYRVHNVSAPFLPASAIVKDMKCIIPLCESQLHTVKDLISHLKQHIVEGRSIACPIRGCKKTFTVKTSFSAHMSRQHRACSIDSINNVYTEAPQPSADTACEDAPQGSNDVDIDDSIDLPHDFYETYLRNVCSFYLKLQGQLLLPASTIQTIVEEIQNVHELGQDYTLSKLRTQLKDDMSLSDDAIAKICDCVKESDLFSRCHQGPLRTIYSRAQMFKKMFKYVEPVKITLGTDEHMDERYAYYIPVKETLSNLLDSELWKNSVSQQSCETDPDILGDISDGHTFKSNQFFIENPGCLKLILYQDAFEMVNPLGSAKTTHKVLAVYLSLANLPAHVRSNTDHMSLVLLCIEKDQKKFGVAKVFSKLLDDLKDLEENGITKGDKIIKGGLCCIAGDNLGSHGIGGFMRNFSRTPYICRYCEITRDEMSDDPNVCGPQRTPDGYNCTLADLQAEDETRKHIKGIRVKCIFNDLKSFHVCQPGLPPCLGHDIFEGVLSFDLALYLKYFIKTKKWLTYTQLNRRIKQLKYKGSEALTKPVAVNSDLDRLSGQAVQNWNLLRLLPVLIGDKIQDPEDDVWQLALQLKDIVDLICAQKISLSQVTYLDVIIQEYLEARMCLFPESPLKPKHHFLRHYPELILKFGPLIRVWTMRFESKHSYFKRCARNLKIFKNPCLTLSERHQMFQAYLATGGGCNQILQVKDSCTFYPSLYSDAIKHAVREFGFSENDTTASTDIQYKGTSYKKGHFLVSKNDESMEFGELLIIIIKNQAVYFVMEVHECAYHSEYHLYSVTKESTTFQCLNINNLVDFYPLPSYILDGHQVIPLKHSVLSK